MEQDKYVLSVRVVGKDGKKELSYNLKIDTIEDSSEYEQYLEPVLEYRKKYGVIS